MPTSAHFNRLVVSACLLVSFLEIGCGGSGNSIITSQNQICSACQFVFASTNSGQLLTFMVSQSSGQLGMPATIAGPSNSTGMAVVTINGFTKIFLYVSDPQNNAIRVFKFSLADGTLSPANVGPFSMDSNGEPGGLVAAGSFLYATSSAGSISAFSVGADGSLTDVPGSPFAAGSGVSHLAASGSDFLYAANTGDGNGSISAFQIGATGALTPAPGSPFNTVANAGPEGLFLTGSNLYVALKNAHAVAGFTIGANGALTAIAGSPFDAGNGPDSLTGTGNFLLVTNSLDATISSYTSLRALVP